MKLIMLGLSSAGKTTFMAALYHRMIEGVYDYTMRYDVFSNYWYKRYTLNNNLYSLDEARKEETELKTVSRNVTRGIYPPPTAIRQEYLFKFRYKNYNDIEFNWMDYRGGALMERSDNSSDMKELTEKIKNSDALIVFLDGTKLEEPLEKNERQFKRMVYLIKTAISSVTVANDTYYPISFVLTKDDICSNVLDSEGFNFFYTNIIKDILESTKVAGMVTWITVNKENIYNVHWPLFFSINHCMHKFVEEVVSSYNRRENNRGFFDSIKEWWTDEDKNSTRNMLEQLQESHKKMSEALSDANQKYLYLI